MKKGYVKGASDNLPRVDLDMLMSFIISNDHYVGSEIRGSKTLKSMRPNYGDSAIGYVQLLRQQSECIVEAKVSPEHKIRNKNYTVCVKVNEKDESILSAECYDCAASLGGCKHAIALLAWLYRRTEEPSLTSVDCYWKKPKLSDVGTTIKYKKIQSIVEKSDKKVIADHHKENNFLADVSNSEKKKNNESHLLLFFEVNTLKTLSLHCCAINYEGDTSNSIDFLKYCATLLTDENCTLVRNKTSDQSKNSFWYELRYGRITASVLYEAAQCETIDGSLVQKILGVKLIDNPAMKRGRELEELVLQKVSKAVQEKIKKCGLILRKQYPAFGASPDSISDNAVFEVKCPVNEKNVERYYKDGHITNKFKAQLHMQMLFANKHLGYFCIAHPNFENNGQVTVVKEFLDTNFILDVIKRAMRFWDVAIFPTLFKYNAL